MSKSPKKSGTQAPVRATASRSPTADFDEVLSLIEAARTRAFAAINHELVGLYWQIGEYISRKLESAAWGEGVVDQLAAYIAQIQPGLNGFNRRNLFRMRQFFETYKDDKKVSPLVTQLPWTHNLLILSRSKRSEEREFYLRMALQERWTKRELERQLNGALFERVVLSPAKVSPVARQLHLACSASPPGAGRQATVYPVVVGLRSVRAGICKGPGFPAKFPEDAASGPQRLSSREARGGREGDDLVQQPDTNPDEIGHDRPALMGLSDSATVSWSRLWISLRAREVIHGKLVAVAHGILRIHHGKLVAQTYIYLYPSSGSCLVSSVENNLSLDP
jgi:predicted nuclease of restriction endonuclease-like (RecB) superfamily